MQAHRRQDVRVSLHSVFDYVPVDLSDHSQILVPIVFATTGKGTPARIDSVQKVCRSAYGVAPLILAKSVRLDGSRVNIWQDRKTLSRVCNECEHAYDLTVVKGRQGKEMSGLSGVTAVADKGRDDEDAKDPS